MTKTLHLRADAPAHIEQAARILQRGGLVAFATETVYGLGANALDPEAVAGIFRAKARPSWDPLIVHVTALGGAGTITRVEGALQERVERLAEAFWPGPLTLLLPRSATVPNAVTAGRPLVGIRVPAHPAAQALLQAVGLPLAAPSANRFGHTSPTTAEHVLADLDGRIDAVLDAGPCAVGVESTVLDPGPTPMVVYRSGAVTAEALRERCGLAAVLFQPEAASLAAEPASLPSPGVGIRHYAPEAELHLTAGNPEALWEAVHAAVREGGRTVGVLLPAEWPRPEVGVTVAPWGRWSEPASLAAGLFAGLRALEALGVQVMVCPLPEAGGLRDALRDRLTKAAR